MGQICQPALLLIPLACGAAPLHVQVVDPSGLGVEDVVVYLEGEDLPSPAAAPAPLEIRQEARRFAPYLGTVQRGEPVLFSNRDNITHHIYSFNGPSRFSFTLRPEEETLVEDFGEAGVIAMGCNIHDWMSGYLLVLNTPWFTHTGPEGRAAFDGLPPGSYRAFAWHPQMREAGPPSAVFSMPYNGELRLQLSRPLDEIPRQEALDDFDFLEAY